MATTRSYSKARAELATLCDLVVQNRETVLIQRRGAEDVALIAASELRSLLETLHLLRSPENAKKLFAAMESALNEDGKESTLEELRADLNLDL